MRNESLLTTNLPIIKQSNQSTSNPILKWASSPITVMSSIGHAENSQSKHTDVLEKVFIGILGALIGAVIMTLALFLLLLSYQNRRRKTNRRRMGTQETSRTTVVEDDVTSLEETTSSLDKTSSRCSRLQARSSIDEFPQPIIQTDNFAFPANIADESMDTHAHAFKRSNHRQLSLQRCQKTWTVKMKNSIRRFRVRPPKPTPRIRLSHKLVSKLFSSKEKSNPSHLVQKVNKQRCLMAKSPSQREQVEAFGNRITKYERPNSATHERKDALPLPSIMLTGPEENEGTFNEPEKEDFSSRLRSNSDPSDQRYHNYMNYPIKSAPERIRDDSTLDTKLYIAETLSTCSSHDYVNFMMEAAADVSRNRIVQRRKKRPRKPPRYYLNSNIRKVTTKNHNLDRREQEAANQLSSGLENESESNESSLSRTNDCTVHVDINAFKNCFENDSSQI